MEKREKRLQKNTLASFSFQICTIICGFIIPCLILQSFGSEVNGLVNSITQFLGIISFLELGVGAVVQFSLYKPLSNKDNKEISKIVISAERFFRRLAQILLAYVVVLICVYPIIVKQNFGFLYTATLIAAMSISSFAQYYFGIVYRLLLSADQRGYISYNAQTVTLLLNTFACFLLIKLGASIQVVKFTTSIIYLMRPAALAWYVRHHYSLDKKIKYVGEPIKQKWNGVAQHVTAVILNGTDSIILTIFSTLSAVSIYSVYNLAINGIKQLLMSMTNGIQALLGELWAKQELKALNSTFSWTEWIIHTGTTYMFGCTALLIVPFVEVYTRGINDANYIQPLFAVLITAANAGNCLRLPYNLMILVGGHFKQTQSNYIIATVMNIVISIIMVHKFGLVGVAIGTLIAMLYQTFWMAIYISKNLIKRPIENFIKQLAIDTITAVLMYATTKWIRINSLSYLSWIIMAIKIASISAVIVVLINLVFYHDKVAKLPEMLKKKGQKV
jgi:O-antigen/teichoic acid export membrane protein